MRFGLDSALSLSSESATMLDPGRRRAGKLGGHVAAAPPPGPGPGHEPGPGKIPPVLPARDGAAGGYCHRAPSGCHRHESVTVTAGPGRQHNLAKQLNLMINLKFTRCATEGARAAGAPGARGH